MNPDIPTTDPTRGDDARATRRRFAAIIGLALTLATFSASAVGQHSVYLYVCKPTVFGAGHAFLGLQPSTGPQAGVERKVGLYPGKSGAKGARNSRGQIRDDDTHDWDYRICYDVDASTYNNLVGAINDDIENGTPYQLCPSQTPGPGTNCAGWATGLLTGAGVCGVPSPTNKLGYPDPYALGCLLEDMVENEIPPVCGELETNGALQATGSPPAALGEGGYSGFCFWGHVDASGLAGALYQPLDTSTAADVNLRVGDKIQLSITGVAPEDITSVDWGDGTEFDYNSSDQYSHVFTATGVWFVSVTIITDGAVQHVSRKVTIRPPLGTVQAVLLWNHPAVVYPDATTFFFPPEFVALFDPAL